MMATGVRREDYIYPPMPCQYYADAQTVARTRQQCRLGAALPDVSRGDGVGRRAGSEGRQPLIPAVGSLVGVGRLKYGQILERPTSQHQADREVAGREAAWH